jgi:hypothetical protein
MFYMMQTEQHFPQLLFHYIFIFPQVLSLQVRGVFRIKCVGQNNFNTVNATEVT